VVRVAVPDLRTSISRIRVSILGSEPEIWRLLEIDSSLSLAEVHDVIQIAFGWRDSHLHAFTSSDGRRWADERWADERSIDEDEDSDDRAATLAEVLDEESGPLEYEYDFGDGWIHQIELIETVSGATSPTAVLIRGERRGPLEDSGGIHGYAEKLQILASPDHPDHALVRDWVDGTLEPWQIGLDPDALDVEQVNRALARRFEGDRAGVGWGAPLTTLVRRMYPGAQTDFGSYLEVAGLDRPVLVEVAQAEQLVGPYRWLLQRVGSAGIKLTAAGWLPPAVVTDAMRELGWESIWIGKHNREDLTAPIANLRESAMQLGLLRRYQGNLVLSRQARPLVYDPVGLFWHLARHWLGRRRSDVERDAAILLAAEIAVGVHRSLDDQDRAIAYGLGTLGWADPKRIPGALERAGMATDPRRPDDAVNPQRARARLVT
jgi:Plasmid pRiA4b ORF-3-like protein